MCTTSVDGIRHEQRRTLKGRFAGTQKAARRLGGLVDGRRIRLHTPTVLAALDQGYLEAIGPDDPVVEIRQISLAPQPDEVLPPEEEIALDAYFCGRREMKQEIAAFAAEHPFAQLNAA